MEQITFIQSAFAGDAVLSLPFLARVTEAYPQAQITVLAAPVGEAIFKLALERGLKSVAPRVRVLRVDKRGQHAGIAGLRSLVKEWTQGTRPDAVFCLQRSFRTGFWAWLSRAPVRVGFASGAAAYLYTHCVPRTWHGGRSEIEKNLDLLRALRPDTAAWDPRTAPSLLAPPQSPAKGNYIAISLGSPWATKRWPVANAAQLCQRLAAQGFTLRLIGDQSAEPLAAELLQLCLGLPIENFCGRSSVSEWVGHVAAAQALVSGDSAAVHIASDLQVPVIALFGPTQPHFGFAPWRRNSRALGVSNLACRPCHIHGPRTCPQGHHRCMKDLSAQEVERALRPFLSSSAS